MILFPPKPTLPVETFIVYILFYLFIFTNQDAKMFIGQNQSDFAKYAGISSWRNGPGVSFFRIFPNL